MTDDSDRVEFYRQEIFELALNIARLQLHGCYMEQGKLNFVSHDEIESCVRAMQQKLEHEAKSVLMAGDWR